MVKTGKQSFYSMRIHFLDGSVVESTTIADWPEQAQITFFRTVASGRASELRFEADLGGEIRWVFIRLDSKVKYISFSSDEMDISVKLMATPLLPSPSEE